MASVRLSQPPVALFFGHRLRWLHLLLLPAPYQDGTYSAAMMDLACSSDLLFYPSSTDDVAAHVQTQLKAAAAAETGLKIRATHR